MNERTEHRTRPNPIYQPALWFVTIALWAGVAAVVVACAG